MTDEQFVKYSYRHSEPLVFHQQHPSIDIEVILLAVDFDNAVFKVAPIDDAYEDKAIWVNHRLIDKTKKKLTIKYSKQ